MLPSGFPEPLVEAVLGPCPDGDPSAIRRVGDSWSATSEQCRTLAETYAAKADSTPSTISGEAGNGLAERYRQCAATLREHGDYCDSLARQSYEGANSIELGQLTWVGMGVVLVAQLAVDAMLLHVGAAKAVADRAAASAGWRAFLVKLLDKITATGLTFTVTRSRMLITATVIGGVLGAAAPLVAELKQIHDGNRKGLDVQPIVTYGVAGAAGGAGGAGLAIAVGPAVSRFVANRIHAAIPGTIVTTFLLGGAGGIGGAVTGTMAAAGVEAAYTGHFALPTRDEFLAGLVTGFVGGVVGGSAYALHAGNPHTPPPPPLATPRQRTDPTPDPHPPARIIADPESPSPPSVPPPQIGSREFELAHTQSHEPDIRTSTHHESPSPGALRPDTTTPEPAPRVSHRDPGDALQPGPKTVADDSIDPLAPYAAVPRAQPADTPAGPPPQRPLIAADTTPLGPVRPEIPGVSREPAGVPMVAGPAAHPPPPTSIPSHSPPDVPKVNHDGGSLPPASRPDRISHAASIDQPPHARPPDRTPADPGGNHGNSGTGAESERPSLPGPQRGHGDSGDDPAVVVPREPVVDAEQRHEGVRPPESDADAHDTIVPPGDAVLRPQPRGDEPVPPRGTADRAEAPVRKDSTAEPSGVPPRSRSSDQESSSKTKTPWTKTEPGSQEPGVARRTGLRPQDDPHDSPPAGARGRDIDLTPRREDADSPDTAGLRRNPSPKDEMAEDLAAAAQAALLGHSIGLPTGEPVSLWLAGETLLTLPRGTEVLIGAADPALTAKLRSRGIAGGHASIGVDNNGRTWIRDNGSALGTKVDGRPVVPLEKTSLRHRDTIELGSTFETVAHFEKRPMVDGIAAYDNTPAVLEQLHDLGFVPQRIYDKVMAYLTEVPSGGIIIGDRPFTQLPGTEFTRPSLTLNGRPWDSITGVYFAGPRQIFINSGLYHYESTILHEFGHAVDQAYADQGRLLSQRDEWKGVHEALTKALSGQRGWASHHDVPVESFAAAFAAWRSGAEAMRIFTVDHPDLATQVRAYFDSAL
ncbi:FHA domain-containing protein [Nocardia sp. NBC_01009]|uniref:FHA domain-containing protein n=1 Tax=Nocardia sp. NBC_01009 TaxID=2975996 RepID=UPI003868CD8D|nr:FHA domain-containing protein [Nocardia sp. NBC_01009]